jgi:hypothetical protein
LICNFKYLFIAAYERNESSNKDRSVSLPTLSSSA